MSNIAGSDPSANCVVCKEKFENNNLLYVRNIYICKPCAQVVSNSLKAWEI